MSDQCRSCRSTLLVPVLDLGDQPVCDAFPPETAPRPDPTWPLVAALCSTCGLVQLTGEVAPVPEEMLAVESSSHRAHAAATAVDIVARLGLGPGATVAEYDSHHGGSWLPSLLGAGLVEAADGATADLVVDVHGIPHDQDFESSLAVRVGRMAPGARFVLEFHHLLPLFEQGQFDTIRHGHTVYLSLTAVEAAFARHGLHTVDVQRYETFGGSLVVTAAASGEPDAAVAEVLAAEQRAGLTDAVALQALQQRAADSARALREHLEQQRTAGHRVLAYGAPSKASVLLTCAGVGPGLLEFTADLSPAKHGRRLPGVAIPIRSPEELLAARPHEILILTWDIADEVRAQLAEAETWGARFSVPGETVRFLD